MAAKLTSEEEAALRELVDVYESGRSVADFVHDRLYVELSSKAEKDSPFAPSYVPLEGFADQKELYDNLGLKGYLQRKVRAFDHGVVFGDLTSAGRCYFKDKAAMEAERAEEQEASRRYARRQAFYAFLASTAVTLVASWKDVLDFLRSLYRLGGDVLGLLASLL